MHKEEVIFFNRKSAAVKVFTNQSAPNFAQLILPRLISLILPKSKIQNSQFKKKSSEKFDSPSILKRLANLAGSINVRGRYSERLLEEF